MSTGFIVKMAFPVGLLCGVGTLFAQQGYMDDTSYTYADSWADTSGVFSYGQTDGVMTNIHDYAVDVTLTSANGRVNSVQGTLFNGSAASTAYLPWDTQDLGTYFTQTTHRGWCHVGLTAFVLTFKFLQGTVGMSQTFYTTPYQDTGFPGSCVYQNTACATGTPTCTGGWGLGFYFACPQYAKATYLTYTRFFQTSCFWVNMIVAATGPGHCT